MRRGPGWRGGDHPLSFPIHAFTLAELGALFERHGLRVVRALGKPLFFQWLPTEVQERILEDEEALSRLPDLELRCADDPGWAGSANHFEIVGIKQGFEPLCDGNEFGHRPITGACGCRYQSFRHNLSCYHASLRVYCL